ncbi:MAG: amidohydrolase family protein, partial [Candidatus Ranarchaeia archaeon]
EKLDREYKADKVIDAEGKAVLPGLINCHTHLYQSLIKNVGVDMPFDPWDFLWVFPTVNHYRSSDHAVSARLAITESIMNGTTTLDEFFYVWKSSQDLDTVCQVIEETGIRAEVAYTLCDMRLPEEWQKYTADPKNCREFTRKWNGKADGRIRTQTGACSIQESSIDLIREAISIARDNQSRMMMHAAGWTGDRDYCINKYDRSIIDHLYHEKILGPDVMLVHCVHISDKEVAQIAKTETNVVHTLMGNLFLGFGVAPIANMIAQGTTIGFGIDGIGSGTQDLFQLMKTTLLVHKGVNFDPTCITAERILEMATIDGAKAIGREKEIGSLEPGKKADVIIVNLRDPRGAPARRIVPTMVLSATGRDVETTIVNGKILMENHELQTLDAMKVLEDAEKAGLDLIDRAGARWLLEQPWPPRDEVWWIRRQ